MAGRAAAAPATCFPELGGGICWLREWVEERAASTWALAAATCYLFMAAACLPPAYLPACLPARRPACLPAHTSLLGPATCRFAGI